jgi:hypothetical protein
MSRTRAENANGRAAQQMVDELNRLVNPGWRVEERLGNETNKPPGSPPGQGPLRARSARRERPHGTGTLAGTIVVSETHDVRRG